jgi:thioredoxin 1
MLEINDHTFEQEVLKAEALVIVDFWAQWCGPCRMLAPVVEEFSRECPPGLKIVKLDVDENPAVTARFAIRSIPSLLFFKKGKIVDQIIGACTKSELAKKVNEVLHAK